MYIILKENELYPLTCDNIIVSVDTVRITCDTILFSSDRYSIEIPYRIIPEFGVNLRFIEDLTGENTIIRVNNENSYIYNHRLKIDFDFIFKKDTTYEFFVTEDGTEKLIFRGKIFYTAQQDTQNYRVGAEDGSGIQMSSIYNY